MTPFIIKNYKKWLKLYDDLEIEWLNTILSPIYNIELSSWDNQSNPFSSLLIQYKCKPYYRKVSKEKDPYQE